LKCPDEETDEADGMEDEACETMKENSLDDD
jgi:hypothetical protein